jgi:hypothetical protein
VLVEGEAQRLTNSGVVVDDEHHRALVDGRVGRRRLSLVLVAAVLSVRMQGIARFLRNDGHLRMISVCLHAQSLPQETAVPYRNSTALDIDWRRSVSDCWADPPGPDGKG